MTILTEAQIAELYRNLPETEKERISAMVAAASSTALPARISGERQRRKNCSHRVLGRLLFEHDGLDGQPRPLHNIWIELWDRDLGADDLLGLGESGRDGRFEIWYDPSDAGRLDRPDLELRLFELSHYTREGRVEHAKRLIYAEYGEENVSEQTYDFGDVRVPYWEYDPETPTPRLMVVQHGTPPQGFAPARTMVMVKNLMPLELKKRKHLLIHSLDADKPSLEQVQADYPDCLTLRLERERPGYTRGDEFFGERILNGMSASVMDRDPADPQLFWIHHHWNSYEHDGEHAAPNVDIWLELRGEKLYPVKIQLQFRRRGDLSAQPRMEEPLLFTPQDGERWLQAKRVARVSAALSAEMDMHLGQTHLNVEQYAVAAYRNFRKSPLRFLLLPHLKEVVLINQEADRWLLGKDGYVTRGTALTADAWGKRLRQTLGMLDWKNWRPRRVISPSHHYARAAHLFWEVITEFVESFFAENETGIRDHWYEVHRFSRDLVEHSVPFFLCEFLRRKLLPDGKFDPQANTWFDTSERMDLTLPRPEVEGQPVAVQPVTLSDESDDDGMENMKQVARYAIFHATFFHSWPNSRQLDDCGELLYNGLGLRHGDHGVLAPESDHSIAPPPHHASEQLWFASALTKTEFGFIMTNEERDVHPKFIELLRARRSEFADLGVDIYRIQSRVNI